MKLFVIVSPKVDPSDLSANTDVLEHISLEFADLLQLTLQNWPLLGSSRGNDEELKAALEHYLSEHAPRRMQDYAHMQELITVLQEAIFKFHSGLAEQLNPILENFDLDVRVNLKRFLHNDVVLCVEHSGT